MPKNPPPPLTVYCLLSEWLIVVLADVSPVKVHPSVLLDRIREAVLIKGHGVSRYSMKWAGASRQAKANENTFQGATSPLRDDRSSPGRASTQSV